MKKAIVFLSTAFLLLQMFIPTSVNRVFADPGNDVTNQIEVVNSVLQIKDADGILISPDGAGVYTNVPRDASLFIRYEFNLLDENPVTAAPYAYLAGDVYRIQLPAELTYAVPLAGKQLLDLNGEVLGVLTVDINGLATITFTNYVETHSGMFGWFEINGVFSESTLGNTTNQPISLLFAGEIISIGIALPVEPNVAVAVAKSGVYNPATNRITWTILVTPAGRTSGITVDDIFSSNQTFVVGSMTKNGLAVTPSLNVATRTVSYTFPSMIETQQTLTYQTAPTATAFNAENGATEMLSFNNIARVFRSGTQLAESSAAVQTNFITKTGSLDAVDKQLIHWSVRVNNFKLTLDGAWINDLLPAGLTPVDGTFYLRAPDNTRTLISLAAVETAGFYTATVQSDNKTLIRYLFDGPISDTYALEFDARVTDLTIYNTNSATTFTNSATMSWATNTSGIPSGTAGVGVIVGGGIISKSVSGNNQSFNLLTNNIQTWTITLNSNKITINNARFADDIPSTMEYIAGSFAVTTVGINGSFTYTPAAPLDLTKSGSLEYVFADPLTTTVTLTFRTKLIKFNALYTNGNVTLNNTAYLHGDGIRDTVQSSTAGKVVASQMIAKDIVSTYNYQTRRITWRLVVNRNQLQQTNVVLSDILPAGLKLLPATFTSTTSDTYQLATIVQADNELTLQDSFTLSFDQPLANQVILTFQTELKEGMFLANGDMTFTNRVTYVSDEIPNLTASVSQLIRNAIVTKSGDYVTGSDYIQWGVTINPNRARLTNIELIDALQVGLSLDTTSINLYAMTLNADGTLTKGSTPLDPSTYVVAYDAITRVFTFQIPGATDLPYRLEFTTDVTIPRIQVNNSITLNGSGTTHNIGSQLISVVVAEDGVSGGGGGTIGQINVTKTSSADPTLHLQGTTYGLYNSFGNLVAEATTNNLGVATFSNLGMKTYTIIELTPTYGYLVDATPIKVRLTTTASVRGVEQFNDPITGSLTINKELRNFANEIIQSTQEFSIVVTGPSYPNGELFLVVPGVSMILTDLILGDYSIVETNIGNYDVTLPAVATLSVENQTQSLTLINQEVRGTLTILKTLLDKDAIEVSTPYTFTVRLIGPSYPDGTILSVINGVSLQLDNLLLGEYRLEEINADAYTVVLPQPIVLSMETRTGALQVINKIVVKPDLPNTGLGTDTPVYLVGALFVFLGILLRLRAKKA